MEKRLLFLLFTILLSFNNSQETMFSFYGDKISIENISDFEKVKQLAKIQTTVETKIEGEIISSCPKKGCWMNVKTGQDTILVRFKDYSFFVPKEGLEKKKVVMRGVAKMDTISVEMLRHYAEDAKLSIEEINKINEPDYSISFLADGVIIKK